MKKPAINNFTAWILVLAYLLIGAGGANAFVWCHETDGYAHLEFNPAGQCEPGCDESSEARNQAPDPSSLVPSDEANCKDVSAAAEQLSSRGFDPAKDLPSLPVSPAPLLPFPSTQSAAVSMLQAPLPPPSPMLAALRTVVLLN